MLSEGDREGRTPSFVQSKRLTTKKEKEKNARNKETLCWNVILGRPSILE